MTTLAEKRAKVLFNMSLLQYKRIGLMKIKNGQSIFQMDVGTGVITEAKYNIERIANPKNKAVSRKVHIYHSPGYIYIVALNIENAYKKFNKIVAIATASALQMKDDEEQSSTSLSLKGDGQISENNPEINTDNNNNNANSVHN